MSDIAILARSRDHTALREFFPDATFLAPGQPKVGARFQRVLLFLKPKDLHEVDWIDTFNLALPRGKIVETIIS